ncbi:MAG: hypothetical protein JST26_04260 [Bacteroidetes bacterium]|nr:hypothetical protein [Bacteroidota bacterium]
MKGIFIFCFSLFLISSQAQTPAGKKLPYEKNPVWGHDYFGLKLGAESYSYGRYPDAVFFQFKSPSPDFIIQKNIILKDISRLYNVSIGGEWSMKNRLYTSLQTAFNPWTEDHFIYKISAGIGYVFSLSDNERTLLRPHIDLSCGGYRYKIGTDFNDVSGQGILLNDRNIGSHISSISYVNQHMAVSPGIDIIYQYEHINFFAGIGYYMPFASKEYFAFKVSDTKTYKVNMSGSDLVADYEGHSVRRNLVENIGFIQARAGMTVRIGETYHNIRKQVAEF